MTDTLPRSAATSRKHVLPNGVRVLIDDMPHVHSAAIGFWVDTGSREEPAELNGACHFLEHMLFKGTARRDALEIAQALEVSGGSLNAFTDKEHTCFHARVLATEVAEALDVLSDMLLNSLLDAKELKREKAVIVEEIKMYDDTPDDVVHELAYEAFWKGHPLGRPITGTKATVRALEPESLRGFMGEHYTPDRLVVALSGKIDESAVLAQLETAFAGFVQPGLAKAPIEAMPHGGSLLRYRDVEQAHLVIAVPGTPATSARRYELALLNAILGGGMSSRLFQEVREKRGLVYSIGSYEALYREGGMFAVHAGMSPKHLPTVAGLIREELEKVRAGGIGEAELELAKRQLKGGLLLSLEVPRHRMSRDAQNELYFGREIPADEVLAAIDAVCPADLAGLASGLFRPDLTLTAVVGPLRKLPPGVA